MGASCAKPSCKPLSGNSDGRYRPQRPFYLAGFTVCIRLPPAKRCGTGFFHQELETSTVQRARPLKPNLFRYANLTTRRMFIGSIAWLLWPISASWAADTRRIVWPALSGGPIVCGPYQGSVLPGKDGGMVVGGPLNGSVWPDAEGGMIVGGPLNGTVWPSAKGGVIVGGPLDGTVWPAASGGLIIGGPLNGYLVVR